MEKIDLHDIYKKPRTDRDTFQELMNFKVREILMIANYYDAYTIEREGQFTDKVYGEYLQVNLYTAPRFTAVASEKEALQILKERKINLIIIMAGLDKETPIQTSRNLKAQYPDIHQLMLVNNNADIAYFHSIKSTLYQTFERLFVWNGSTKIFLVMAKYIEDKINFKTDTERGDIRLILLVEDSVRYYSRYLPILYTEIMTQTQKLIKTEPNNSDMSLIMKIRVRPKVILVSTFEEATEIIDKYKDNMLCLMSDVEFPHNGKLDENAGIELIRYLQNTDNKIPCLLQSHDTSNAKKAKQNNAEFINKDSATLAHDLTRFIKERLGFGDFIFKDKFGFPIDKATSLEEFKQKVQTVPDESLKYHMARNGISTWLMARGEISLAKQLRRYDVNDFTTTQETRKFILNIFDSYELKKIRGTIVNFRQQLVNSNHYITRLGKGSLGGKGRGMAFLSNFIENVNLNELIPGLDITIPKTAIIGTEEYDNFIETNDLTQTIYLEKDYKIIRNAFLKSSIPAPLRRKLRDYLEVMTKPLAIRSSGLFEDTLNQPFAGVYATYLIPNNKPTIEQRLLELETAIKLIYASIYTDDSRAYFKAVDYVIEEEKMGIIIQEVVGDEYNGRYYPHISGVAQSYNFYPFSYIQPDDGFAVIALGLGCYVVGGEKTCRFCPRYPQLQLASIQDMARDSQTNFYGIDMKNADYDLTNDGEEAALKKYSIKQCEEDGNLDMLASVFDYMNDRISLDLNEKGIRIVNFPGLLQYNQIPLPNALNVLLDIFSQAMGSPVEIEFSLQIKENEPPTLYLLQIKPMIRNEVGFNLDDIDLSKEDILIRATKGMGNGKIENIHDIIYVDPDSFDRLKTEDMAEQVRAFNNKMIDSNTPYLLIGPGRWGTRDKFTGIPVTWSDIAGAKIIIELGLKDYPLEASLGSHFFHNVTSMKVGYFSIPYNTTDSFINFEALRLMPTIEQIGFVRHIRLDKPITALMDGKKQIAAILL